MISETAPAKLNMYLHIGPVRSDGLHELRSLFVFTEDGDRLHVTPSNEFSLDVTGPFAEKLSGLSPEDNLVWRAAEALKREAAATSCAAITLEKNLPVAAGIGGGSADAAAVLRALVRLWKVDFAESALSALAFRLGADVPACLSHVPVFVSGAGEHLTPGPRLPALWVCVANPGVDMPTGPVFRKFDAANPTPRPPENVGIAKATLDAVKQMIADSRNDLEPSALELEPVIGDMLVAMHETPDVIAARLSGSGASVFALYPSAGTAQAAAQILQRRGWWAMASRLAAS